MYFVWKNPQEVQILENSNKEHEQVIARAILLRPLSEV
jgi:hypothetical protein